MTERDHILKFITQAEGELAVLNQARERAISKLEKLRSDLDLLNKDGEAVFSKYASPEEKVWLFAELFRGRDDVFARLWISHKTGKKGYSPVCEYEWQPDICTKPETKCTNCKYVPLTSEALQAHLEGKHVIGIYPLCKEETTYFLAIDFDRTGWKDEVAAFLEICKSMNVPAALERSRSGNGGHVWIFFSEAIPASVARNLGSYLLTETMSRHHQLSMTSYDRLFPNQDTMPKGGFGNLIGIFVAPPGSGKTVVGIYLLAQRQLSTLVLVHRKPLLEQWHSRLVEFLNLPPEQIGCIGGGKDSRTGRIDVAMLQSLARKGEVDPLVGEYGHVIVDECHHIPAVSFEKVLKQARARYVTGLTATPYRRDGHDPIITMQCGPVRCRIDSHDTNLLSFKRRLICRETGFVLPNHHEMAHHEILDVLAKNEWRNQLIIDDLINVLQESRAPIILTERRDHVELLREGLAKHVKHLIVLHGGKDEKMRRETQQKLKAVPEDEARVILATGAYVGEGFDDHRLDTLFLAMPISFKGKMEQYAGRILRPHPGKTEVRIYDYVDGKIPMLARMFTKRLQAYRAMKYEGEEITKIKKHPLAKAESSQLWLKALA